MTPVKLNLPAGAVASNYLYPEMSSDDLGQDILTIALPNGYYIDAGWYPEGDPEGRFVIRVFWQYWDHQKLDSPIEARTVSDLVSVVEILAERFARQQIPTSRASVERSNRPFILKPA